MSLKIAAAFIETMRPKQWIKNLLVYAGALFSLKFFDPASLISATAAFFLFCMISGCVYIMNDLLDYKRDLVHPEKRNRPIPSGRLPRSTALILLVVVFVFSFGVS